MEVRKRRSRPSAPVTAQSGKLVLQRLHGRQFGRFHHLADAAIGQHDHDRAVFFGQVKGQHGQVDRFLHAGRRQDDRVVIAVPAAVHHLVVVGLGRGDVAQAGSAAHHIHQHHRALRCRRCRTGLPSSG